MIGLAVKSKKELKTKIGQDISHLVVETSILGKEFTGNDSGIPYVGPSPYTRKFFGQIWTEDGVLVKCK